MGITKANGSDVLQHTLNLNDYGLGSVPFDKIEAVKNDVADFLKNEIVRQIHSGNSPVKGEQKFKRLETDYAKKEKGGIRLSNLQLEGDLLDSFKVTPSTGANIVIGHKGSQVPKADGHNQSSIKAKLWAADKGYPKRRYIPSTGQVFDDKITNEIRNIIKEKIPESIQKLPTIKLSDLIGNKSVSDSVIQTTENVAVTLDNFLSNENISQALIDELTRLQSGL